MGDYGRPLEFGLSLVPDAAAVTETRELAVHADALGLDLLGIQDHPYQWRFLETYMLMADLLARTERLRVFPDAGGTHRGSGDGAPPGPVEHWSRP